MNKNLKILMCITLLTLGTSIVVSATNNDRREKQLYTEATQLESELKQITNDELVTEIHLSTNLSKNLEDSSSLIPYASALYNKIDDFSNEEIINIITNIEFQPEMKEIFIDFYTIKNENSRDKKNSNIKLKELLYNSELEQSVKEKIIVNSEFEISEIPLLKEFIAQNNSLSFYSLKKLGDVDLNEAYNISTKILKESQNSENLVSSAVSVISRYITENKSLKNISEVENQFLKESLEIFNTSNSQLIKDSITFSISEIRSLNSFKQLVSEFNIDHELKVFAIDQNFMILKDLLVNNPTKSNVKFVLECMTILPIKEFYTPLENIKIKNLYPDLNNDIDLILEKIEKEGINENKKWLID